MKITNLAAGLIQFLKNIGPPELIFFPILSNIFLTPSWNTLAHDPFFFL